MFFEFDDFDVRERFYTIEEKTERLKLHLESISPQHQETFSTMCVRAYVYHDSALDGVVISNEELSSAFGMKESPGYVRSRVMQEIFNHRDMVLGIRSYADERRSGKDVYPCDVVRYNNVIDLHQLLYRNISRKDPGTLRKVTPLHSSYFHNLIDPKMVEKQLENLCRQTEHPEFRAQHAINQAVLFHQEFMKILPFLEGSGKIGRLIMNSFLLQGGYNFAIIHGSERQRYYETLRDGSEALRDLLLDNMESSLDSQLKFVQTPESFETGARVVTRSLSYV